MTSTAQASHRSTNAILAMVFFASVTGIIAGCSHQQGAVQGGTPTEQAANSSAKRYKLNGKVLSVDKTQKFAQIDGQDIPGFMAAMTMNYPIVSGADLDKIGPGDQITGDVVVTPDGYHLENITVLKKGTGAASTPGPSSELHIPQAGDAVPDFALTNQDGKRIHLSAFRGDVLLVTFVYTQCPFPNFCPLVSKNFADIYAGARKDPALSPKMRLLTISFDPQHDTPAVLKKYGESFHAITGGAPFKTWEFATAKPQEMQKIADFFGISYSVQQGVLVHSMSTSVITPDGKIYKWYDDANWKPDELMKDASEAMLQDAPAGGATQAALRLPAPTAAPPQAN